MSQRYGVISDEALAVLRQRIGVPIEEPQPFVEEATKDAIRHWAHGIGDVNPLWCHEDYAMKTNYGDIIAPPTILYAMSRIVGGYVGGLPGVHAMYAGTDWEWLLPIRRNDRIAPQSYLKDLVERKTSFAGRAIQQVYHTSFTNQHGQLVAQADSWCFRTERPTARRTGKYRREGTAAWKYSPHEIAAIEADYAREVVRGVLPRYWEGVAVGEELPPVVKGPVTVTSVIAFDQGWGGLYLRAHGLAFDLYRRHPALAIPNAMGVPEPPERVHWDTALARQVGVPGAFDYGPERVSWLGHLLTNWMGDEGFLKKLRVEIRRHNLLGDTTWCRGQVVRKSVAGHCHLVECQVWAQNQRGEVTAEGSATVVLPSAG